MADYTFLMSDTFGDSPVENPVTTELAVNFSAETLDTIAERMFWFLRSAGFSYITSISIGKRGGDFTGFSSDY